MAAAQRNCNVYKMQGDSCRYKACLYIENAPDYFQLKREFHEIFDEAIEICPEYSDAYRAKSVAYLKTGDFITWKKLMDKAVALNPKDHLGYRGWCRFQFFRDYEGAIEDLEQLRTVLGYDIGFSQNGHYHLEMAIGLCYKMIGDKEKAISIMEKYLRTEGVVVGLFDYLHLGVLYMEVGSNEKAMNAFQFQSEHNELADNQYYLGLLHKKMGNQDGYEKAILKAKELYENGIHQFDPYTHQVDNVYYADIQSEINVINK